MVVMIEQLNFGDGMMAREYNIFVGRIFRFDGPQKNVFCILAKCHDTLEDELNHFVQVYYALFHFLCLPCPGDWCGNTDNLATRTLYKNSSGLIAVVENSNLYFEIAWHLEE